MRGRTLTLRHRVVPKKAHAHASQGALPLGRQRKQSAEAGFKESDLVTFSNLIEAKLTRSIHSEYLKLFNNQESKETALR